MTLQQLRYVASLILDNLLVMSRQSALVIHAVG